MTAICPEDLSPIVSVLRCEACRRAAKLSEAELIQLVRAGWPTCCGRVMGLPAPPLVPSDN
jgi:hypothetical protein